MADSNYGKLAGAGIGNLLGGAAVELADQYLSHPLGATTIVLVMVVANMAAVYLAKHGWMSSPSGATP